MMLDLTTADAIAFGSLCAALLAAYAGRVRGEQAGRDGGGSGAAAAGSIVLVREDLRDLTAAIEDLASAVRTAAATGEARDQLSDTVRDLLRRIDERSTGRG